MNLVPSESKERNSFIERSVNTALDFYSKNNAQLDLYEEPVNLARILGNYVVPNIVDGVATIPKGTDENAVAVYASKNEEQLILSNDFYSPLERQRKTIIKSFDSWQPTSLSSESFVDSYIEQFKNFDDSKRPPGPKSTAAHDASTFSMALMFDLEQLKDSFTKLPNARLGKIPLRPLISFRMKSDNKANIGLVTHETVHASQFIYEPLMTYSSQKDADRKHLRKELAAYHIAAMTELRILGRTSIKSLSGKDMESSMQLQVEAIRTLVNKNDLDPFSPIQKIYEVLAEIGKTKDDILHTRLDFDGIVAQFDNLKK